MYNIGHSQDEDIRGVRAEVTSNEDSVFKHHYDLLRYTVYFKTCYVIECYTDSIVIHCTFSSISSKFSNFFHLLFLL